MEIQPRRMTADDLKQGHAPCGCGEYTHIFSQRAMERLPRDYSGEVCERCDMWMCRLDGRVQPALPATQE